MFSIGIQYLCGWSMATHPGDRLRAEWPPHPDRIFQALVAAHHESDGDRDEHAALAWLSELPSPAIHASGHSSRTVATSYVPANGNSALEVSQDGTPLLPHTWGLNRPRVARTFPVAVPEQPLVHLIWPDSEASAETRPALDALCRKVTAVGHSASLVQVWIEDHPPETPTHRPTDRLGADERLRVPGPGRLDELEALYPEVRPSPRGWIGYECVSAAKSDAAVVCETVFAPDLVVLRRVNGPQLGLESTLIVTEALRGAVMANCPVQPLPDWISGHEGPGRSPGQKPHLACLALGHVGREHADGHLLGAALAIPRDVPAPDQGRCLSQFLFDANGQPHPIRLNLGRLGFWEMLVEDREDRPMALRPDTWTGNRQDRASPCWASVTPIVLDKYPKRDADFEVTIRQACLRVGLPEPERVVVTPAPFFVGARHARNTPPLATGPAKTQRFHTHALIEFSTPVRGPVLLGAGRYRGYGLFRPWPTEVAPG